MANRTGKRAGVKLSVVLLSVFLFLLLFSPVAFAATYGDINNDGVINVQDVVLVMKHALDLEELTATQQAVADVNGDGNINVQDVTLIMQYSLGLIDEFPHAALAVSKVTAVNPKQVEVEFNRVLSATEKAKMLPANFVLALQASPTTDRLTGAVNDGSAVAIMDDNKAVLLTMANGFNFANGSTTNRVVVKQAIGLAADYNKADLVFTDTSVPTLVSVQTDSPRTIVMTFSEPLDRTVLSPSNITLNGSLIPLNLAGAVYVDARRELRIDTFTNLAAGSYTIAILSGTNLKDYSGFSVVPTTKTFTHTPVTTAPTVSVKSSTERTVTIEFSRAIDPATLNNNANVLFRHTFDSTVSQVTGTSVTNPSGDAKTFVINFADKLLPPGTTTMWMRYAEGTADANKVKDSWGNIIVPFSLSVTTVPDTTPPTATVSAVAGSNTLIDVQYSKEVTGADVKANYTLKKGTATVTIDTVTDMGNNKYRLSTGAAQMQGLHTLTIANIRDTTPAQNAMGTKTYNIDIPDTIKPTVGPVMANTDPISAATVIFVYYSEPMGSSALDPANYRLVNTGNTQYSLPAGTTITQTVSTIRINLPKTLALIKTDLGSPTDITKLFIGNVKDIAGNTIAVIETHNILDAVNFNPSPSNITVNSETQVTFTVSRQLQSADRTKIKKSGGAAATSLSISNNEDGTATITANFAAGTFSPFIPAVKEEIDIEAGALTDLNGFTNSTALNQDITIDKAPPRMVSAKAVAVNQIEITYSEKVANNDEVPTQYVFRIDGVTAYTVSSIAVVDDKVTLTLASSVLTTLTNYPSATITYTQANTAANRTRDLAVTPNSAVSPQTLTGITSGF